MLDMRSSHEKTESWEPEFQASHEPTEPRVEDIPSHEPIPLPEPEEGFISRQIEKFKERARQFMEAFELLIQLGKSPALKSSPELQREYNDLLSEGNNLKAKIEWLNQKIDAVMIWGKDSFGSYDSQDLREYTTELGAFPLLALIPIAAIAGVLALITKYLSDVYMFQKKMQTFHDLVEVKKVPPSEAARILGEMTFKPSLMGVGTLVKWVVIGGILWYVYTNFVKKD